MLDFDKTILSNNDISINRKFLISLQEVLDYFNSGYYSSSPNRLSKFEIIFDNKESRKFSLYIEYEQVENNSLMTKFIGNNYLLNFDLFKNYLHILFNISGDMYGKTIDIDTLAFLENFEKNGYNVNRLTINECQMMNFANIDISLEPHDTLGSCISLTSARMTWPDLSEWLDNIIK